MRLGAGGAPGGCSPGPPTLRARGRGRRGHRPTPWETDRGTGHRGRPRAAPGFVGASPRSRAPPRDPASRATGTAGARTARSKVRRGGSAGYRVPQARWSIPDVVPVGTAPHRSRLTLPHQDLAAEEAHLLATLIEALRLHSDDAT